ncbi:MAG: bifunctional 2-C-methyl-D-erythritol 4-phosphate cytidylyltransferase/2-C-methyl-D-erythritol 2,4-cyclodiphosphate synthase [Paracoccaceae bacterium]|nr:bifunctional 2-C-methyl-D-erythritol 4-phosphate cytidylyltransferase/2-C-methyl-D-erythritol 2,4-cyclodiphosphate synthase [Paracoccaceae bacterium]
MQVAAVIVAAGRGTRAGGGLPKQWRALAGKTVAERTLEAFAAHPRIGRIVLVLHPDDIESDLWPAGLPSDVVSGGATRAASVKAGLAVLEGEAELVLIHDIARPLVSADVIDRVIAGLATHDGAAPAVPVTDALWRGEADVVTGTVERAGLYRAQTPQGFDLAKIIAAHDNASEDAADDVQVARQAGIDVAIVAGDTANLKITTSEDFSRAERLLAERNGADAVRVGNGFDVHRFGPGSNVTLCGVDIPFDRGLQGHSDADVAMHTVTDAIYGALAEGDIGQHFPPSDPQWKGAASHIFLEHAVALAAERGFAIGNVDCTIICEVPKIGPHAPAMRARMAEIMGLRADQVGVKATTSERLGFTGRGEGIAALATVTLVRT